VKDLHCVQVDKVAVHHKQMLNILEVEKLDRSKGGQTEQLDICRFEMVGAQKVKFHSTSIRPDAKLPRELKLFDISEHKPSTGLAC